ncbi:MAG TPA: acyl-CoA dehydrogenase family protein, partial [Candidatus Deferrimicrobiaceae bacterium]|nr:acyl-CoA dehydrogenase family protein [Candidatus Deferrimicrobiaceae bacterium]
MKVRGASGQSIEALYELVWQDGWKINGVATRPDAGVIQIERPPLTLALSPEGSLERPSAMDFDFTPEQQAFRQEVRAWLAENVPADLKGRGFASSRADVREVNRLREWQRALHKAGYVGMDWPAEYGGRGASIMEQVILYEELSHSGSPQPLNRSGLSMLGPTLMKHGTPAQRARHLDRILTAEDIWCQGFSEPNAGSDLANLQTRAVLDGDQYVLNGQKVWT